MIIMIFTFVILKLQMYLLAKETIVETESRRTAFEEDLMSKIAWYYYIDNLTQQQIADQVGIPRLRVIKLLEKARQYGIIQFKIAENNAHVAMENAIAKRFGIKDVFIVPSATGMENRNEALAQAAAIYIANRLSDNAFINMGYGDTTCRVLNHLANNSSTRISVVSLTGGVSYYLPNTFSSTMSLPCGRSPRWCRFPP